MKESQLQTDILDEDDDYYVQMLQRSIAADYAKQVGKIQNELEEEMSLDSSSNGERNVIYPVIKPPTPVHVTSTNEELKSASTISKNRFSLVVGVFALFVIVAFILGAVYLQPDNIAHTYLERRGILQHERITPKENSETETGIGKENYQHSLQDEVEIPIFLNLPGTSSLNSASLLHECSGLKSISINDYFDSINQVRYFGLFLDLPYYYYYFKIQNKSLNFDYVTATSLCGLNRNAQKHQHNQFKVFLIIQNPITRMMQHYVELNTKNKWARQNLKTFTEYVEWPSKSDKRNNILTRSILCKMKGELTNYDLNITRTFLQNHAYVGNSLDYVDTIKGLKDKFHWKIRKQLSSVQVDNCLNGKLKKVSLYHSRLLQMHGASEDLLHRIYRENYHDFSIYLDHAR